MANRAAGVGSRARSHRASFGNAIFKSYGSDFIPSRTCTSLTTIMREVTDLAGNPLASALSYDFYALAGDANRDRYVDVSDLSMLATNWQTTGRTFSQGDFNYDGLVNVTDLGILATNWQKNVVAPSSPVAASMLSLASKTSRKTNTRAIDQIELL